MKERRSSTKEKNKARNFQIKLQSHDTVVHPHGTFPYLHHSVILSNFQTITSYPTSREVLVIKLTHKRPETLGAYLPLNQEV